MNNHTYSIQNIIKVVRQILEGLAVIHSNGLIHRDVKPGNVIIDTETKDTRLIDFGLAEFYFPYKEYNVRIATKPYKPPEILVNYRKYFQSFDIWGVGNILGCMVLLAEFLTLRCSASLILYSAETSMSN